MKHKSHISKRLAYLNKVNHAIRLLYPCAPGWSIFKDGKTLCLKHFQFKDVFRATTEEIFYNLAEQARNGSIFLRGKNLNSSAAGWGENLLP